MAEIGGKARIFLLIPCFVPHDAVGNDVLGMFQALKAAGHDVRILAAEFHRSYADIASRLELESPFWNSTEDILIYHHAIGWPLGEAVLARTRNRIVVKYHNITPARFFEKYAQHYFNACVEGELATRRIARIPSAMFWGDSQFNAEELITFGAPRERCRWVPPCHLIEKLGGASMDPAILGTYRDGFLNILFVGGMKPNKGHLLALRAFAAYRHVYNRRSRLIFVGSFDKGLSPYLEQVKRAARRFAVEPDVIFAHSVTDERLKTFYYAADVFLCVSEHEGFCVPLVEAMAFRVPILAWAQTAVGETMGQAGIVYEEFDPIVFADALEEYHRDHELRLTMADQGRSRYELEFHPDAIRRKLLNLVREVEMMPHA